MSSLAAILLVAAAVAGLFYALRVYRRGWCNRKGGGRVLRYREPAIFWFEIGSVTTLSVGAFGVAAFLILRSSV